MNHVTLRRMRELSPAPTLVAWNMGRLLSEYIVTCLQVLLTPTCRVSVYPRQLIKVDAAETTTVYLDNATNSYNAYNNYTTRRL
jgi:hypothetical protein